MQVTPDNTIGEIVGDDFRAASVFQSYGIDFCCGGRRTLAEACEARQLSAADVLKELLDACRLPDQTTPRYANWDTSSLIIHIVERHHAFVRRALPALLAYTSKIAAVHGERHPELREVAQIVREVDEEMTLHMAKEERILFPYITIVAEAASEGRPLPTAPFGSIDNPIRMMEADHDSTGDAMARIRSLTGGYQPPAEACTTYRVCLQELEAFERDLHEHVHLENNVLFPRARAFFAAAGL